MLSPACAPCPIAICAPHGSAWQFVRVAAIESISVGVRCRCGRPRARTYRSATGTWRHLHRPSSAAGEFGCRARLTVAPRRDRGWCYRTERLRLAPSYRMAVQMPVIHAGHNKALWYALMPAASMHRDWRTGRCPALFDALVALIHRYVGLPCLMPAASMTNHWSLLCPERPT